THNRIINARGRDATETERAMAAIGPVAPNAGRGRGAAPAGPAAAGETARGGAPPAPAAPPAAATANAAPRVDFQTARNVELPVPPQITASDAFFEFVFSGSGQSYETLKALAAKQE